MGVLLLSLVQTVVVPVLPQIATQLHTSATAVGWVTTSTMLTASALTPLLGRLGDVFGVRRVIIASIIATLIGSILAATTDTIALLIVARVLQGASFGLFPLGISVLRSELPPAKLTGAMAIVASTLGVGGGVALVATGLLTQNNADYRRIFWLCVIASVITLILSIVALPKRAGAGGQVDYRGALVLAVGLVCLLLPLSQGHEWGWTSARVLVLFAAAVVILVGFLLLQHRTAAPLVSTDLLARGPVLVTNLAAMCIGFAMFAVFLGASYFVQSPREISGFGFTADVLETSVVYMLPGALVSMLIGPVAGMLVRRIGPRLVLALACGIGVVGMLLLAFVHTTKAETIVAIIIANCAIAMAYAAMPALLVAHVAPAETGIANSINSIMRTVGASIGSALVVTILASQVKTFRLPTGTVDLPTQHGFDLTFVLGAVALAIGGLLSLFGLRHPKATLTERQVQEDESLALAGEFAIGTELDK